MDEKDRIDRINMIKATAGDSASFDPAELSRRFDALEENVRSSHDGQGRQRPSSQRSRYQARPMVAQNRLSPSSVLP